MSSPSDPRSPNSIKAFYREKFDPEEGPLDYYNLCSLLASMMGLLLKYKICSWIAVFACLGSIANVQHRYLDSKQILVSLVFTSMSVFAVYFGERHEGRG